MINEFYWPDIVGGTETYLRNVSEALVKKNDVFIICNSSNNKFSKEFLNNVRIYRIPTDNFYPAIHNSRKPMILKPFWYLRSLKSNKSNLIVQKILDIEKPDIVHTHNLFSLSKYIFKGIKELNIPLIYELHDCYLLCPTTSLNYFWGRICHSSSPICRLRKYLNRTIIGNMPDFVIAPSQAIIDRHKENGFFKTIKTRQIFLGIELPNQKIDKNYETIDILYVGSLSKHKGPQTLIKAFHSIKNPIFRLHIVGDGKERTNLENLARGDNRIRFYGYISEGIEKFYSQANIVVVPSLCFEAFGMVIIEAFAYDTPVIGSRVGGIPELIKDGKTGLLFKPGNTIDLSKKLMDLNQSKLDFFVRNVRNDKKKYSMKLHLNELLNLYRDLII